MKIFTLLLFLFTGMFCFAQNVTIDNYSTNIWGQVQLEIQASADKYYILTAEHGPNYEDITSMTMGVDGTMNISEPLGAYPIDKYTITEHSIASPDDVDGDGIDDLTEFNNMPTDAPLNFAEAISFVDGTTSIDDAATFASLAVVEDVPWAPFLNGQQFVKFGILDKDTDEPKVYFINSNTHFIHGEFFSAIGQFGNGGDDGSGEIVFNPNEILPNGVVGSYSFNFSFGDAETFESTQRTFELLAANMPFLKNNLQHFIGGASESDFNNLYKDDYIGSRIPVRLESEVFNDIDFIPFHQAEGFGYFRHMTLNENPGSRDIVLYDALPNSLPRVGGIITSVVQTPLSHVNLRAIQDNVPNAYINNPLGIDSIVNLLNDYIYYKVENDKYIIRAATLDEVNAWFENLRPTESQIPERNLSFTEILPLDSIEFGMSTSFGAKCSNVATMRKFGFPEGTIPNGFGIPFYFYDEFMKFNNFYEDVEDMISDTEFINDLEIRIERLKDFRRDIKDAPMPQWMLDELQAMHDAFPAGTAVRVRSSTNNEDLPGFSGAGLYTSKTQHLDEGHIQKSVKQVYASMWNFRAYEERDFYRVDHYIAAMGLLCHPNFEDEKSNGVGVSIDPIYNTSNTFYLNTQVGESLITNPDANSIPEELLLYQDPSLGYSVLRESNLVNTGELVMGEQYLNQMRDYLQVIHDEFEILYDVVGAEGFGMDIEYKVTVDDQLIIKQARPWVSFWANIKAANDLEVSEIVNPQNSDTLGTDELVSVRIANSGLKDMDNFDLSLTVDGDIKETLSITDTLMRFTDKEYQFSVPQDFSMIGDYNLSVIVSHPNDGYSKNDTLDKVLTKLHILEGSMQLVSIDTQCGNSISLQASITNLGGTTFENARIEVQVNGQIVETVDYNGSIPYLSNDILTILVDENLVLEDNEIILRLLTVNGQQDAISNNNEVSVLIDLANNTENLTLVLNSDQLPGENSWEIFNQSTNQLVASGEYNTFSGGSIISDEICLVSGTCYTLKFYDSYGDGICCSFGEGSFSLLDSNGEILVFNDGDFGSEAEANFCTSGEIVNTTDLLASNSISVFPNPVSDLLVIEFGENFNSSDDVKIEVYDNLGRLLDAYILDQVGSDWKTELPFTKHAPGLYMVKCFNNNFESNFKIIKN